MSTFSRLFPSYTWSRKMCFSGPTYSLHTCGVHKCLMNMENTQINTIKWKSFYVNKYHFYNSLISFLLSFPIFVPINYTDGFEFTDRYYCVLLLNMYVVSYISNCSILLRINNFFVSVFNIISYIRGNMMLCVSFLPTSLHLGSKYQKS